MRLLNTLGWMVVVAVMLVLSVAGLVVALVVIGNVLS